jgi:hypothetical protein
MTTTFSIPGNFTHGDDLILVRRKDYEGLNRKLAEIKHALKIIRAGEEEYRQSKIKPIKSLHELIK